MKLNKMIIVLLSILLTPAIALASWVKLSPEELVGQSKLAVIGEFIGTTRIATIDSGKNLIVGVIKVETVLAGAIQDDFLLIAIRRAGVPLVSSTIDFKKGQTGLWLLKQYSADNTALYSASHPQQFTSSSDTDTINHLKKTLAQLKKYN
ncbi:MAG: hypothetical protein HRT54_17880 [Colwellia sp.]|nr:hypothetical protein [Colwellia sp.]